MCFQFVVQYDETKTSTTGDWRWLELANVSRKTGMKRKRKKNCKQQECASRLHADTHKRKREKTTKIICKICSDHVWQDIFNFSFRIFPNENVTSNNFFFPFFPFLSSRVPCVYLFARTCEKFIYDNFFSLFFCFVRLQDIRLFSVDCRYLLAYSTFTKKNNNAQQNKHDIKFEEIRLRQMSRVESSERERKKKRDRGRIEREKGSESRGEIGEEKERKRILKEGKPNRRWLILYVY